MNSLPIPFGPELSSRPCLSVVMPAFNEGATIQYIIKQVLAQPSVQELIVVDDCSSDGTRDIIQAAAAAEPRIKLIRHGTNLGKGAAIRTGFQHVQGPIVIIQDADLEYSPEDYPALLAPILADKADVVFGSRFIGGQAHRVLYFWHYLGNLFLTLLSNMATNLNLTDMECCYKLMRREVLQRLHLEESRFGIEPEITAKVSRLGVRIYEVAVAYHGRTYQEGKKIGWKDGFRAIWCIAKYGVFRR